MSARKHFIGQRVPITERVKRAKGSSSFKQTGTTVWEIKTGKNKGKLDVCIIDAKNEGFDLEVNHRKQGYVGGFSLIRLTNNTWKIFDRFVVDDYRGYAIGRNLFRLAEQETKKRRGKRIEIDTNQPDVILTALKLGYKLTPYGINKIRRALRLRITDPFPKKAKLLDLLTTRMKAGLGAISEATIQKELI
ncbi:MAG: GNAT family N-acetyltransferase [Candidatus Diapherotrites archaeon]|jgi:hypothetical protein|nr:GNAT family N-acetyltransferase [Candidatus Diapherotrites archaeon]MBT4597204.1 GNAT family N-acetyltransferase [Candidatus Diapherotrites archaeon]